MQQNGYFPDKCYGVYLITEFREGDQQAKMEANIKYEDTGRHTRNEITMDFEEQVVGWIIHDIWFTYLNAFAYLKTELIRFHLETGHDIGLPISRRPFWALFVNFKLLRKQEGSKSL